MLHWNHSKESEASNSTTEALSHLFNIKILKVKHQNIIMILFIVRIHIIVPMQTIQSCHSLLQLHSDKDKVSSLQSKQKFFRTHDFNVYLFLLQIQPILQTSPPNVGSSGVCILCQKEKLGMKLSGVTKRGLAVMRDATWRRMRCNDHKMKDTICRLKPIINNSSQYIPHLVWHSSCYSSFTDKRLLKALEERTFNMLQSSRSFASR